MRLDRNARYRDSSASWPCVLSPLYSNSGSLRLLDLEVVLVDALRHVVVHVGDAHAVVDHQLGQLFTLDQDDLLRDLLDVRPPLLRSTVREALRIKPQHCSPGSVSPSTATTRRSSSRSTCSGGASSPSPPSATATSLRSPPRAASPP